MSALLARIASAISARVLPPALVLILVLFVAGYVSARLGAFPENASDVLNRFVLYVCLPALILALVPNMRLRSEHVALVIVPWTLLAVSSAAVVLTSRALGFRRDVEGALLLCMALGNTSFLGFPMAAALLGESSVRLALVYDQLGSFVILSTFGLFVQARYGGQGDPTVASMAKRVVTFPPFVALCVAIVIGRLGITIPATIEPILKRVGDALVPIAMFAVGLKTRLRLPEERTPFVFGLTLKMLVLPLVAWAIVGVLGTSHEIAQVAVFESAVPPMITAGALAMMAGLAPELSAALVGYGVLLAMVTLRVWAAVLR